MRGMPTLARLPACLPPHFHVRVNDGREALVEIATLTVLQGRLRPRELAEALAWARDNQPLLHAKWKELNP